MVDTVFCSCGGNAVSLTELGMADPFRVWLCWSVGYVRPKVSGAWGKSISWGYLQFRKGVASRLLGSNSMVRFV